MWPGSASEGSSALAVRPSVQALHGVDVKGTWPWRFDWPTALP